jgi:hypothetical protein
MNKAKLLKRPHAPFTKAEASRMDDMLERLITDVTKTEEAEQSRHMVMFCEDLIDLLVDIKVDLTKYIERN